MGGLRGTPAWSVGLETEPTLSYSIREEEAALCLDCLVTFNVRNRTCPKCDGEQFWLTARWKRPSEAPVAFERRSVRASPRLRRAS